MTANANKNFARAMNILEEAGLLLIRGLGFPDVCGLVTQHRIKSSWWGDPAGPEIFSVCEMISDHPDITTAKLISGNVTFVHRDLWQKLAAVGRGRDEWKMKKLSTEATRLLKLLDKEGTLLTNKIGPPFLKKPGDIARELELKLLIHSDQIHTGAGTHAKVLETWDHWGKRVGLRSKSLESWRAQAFFEKRVKEITKSDFVRLPWQSKRK